MGLVELIVTVCALRDFITLLGGAAAWPLSP
jgi:hypothetical protein